jgi:hypothetical protein
MERWEGVAGGERTVSGVLRVSGAIVCRRMRVFGFAGERVRSGGVFFLCEDISQ